MVVAVAVVVVLCLPIALKLAKVCQQKHQDQSERLLKWKVIINWTNQEFTRSLAATQKEIFEYGRPNSLDSSLSSSVDV